MRKYNKLSILRLGDWLVLVASLILVSYLFLQLSPSQPAQKIQIRLGNQVYGTYSLNQHKRIKVQGQLGVNTIEIHYGKARIAHAPCHNQYCVKQGWLRREGQLATCIPNQVTLQLLGKVAFDSLSY